MFLKFEQFKLVKLESVEDLKTLGDDFSKAA
jgi:hypothetical protein